MQENGSFPDHIKQVQLLIMDEVADHMKDAFLYGTGYRTVTGRFPTGKSVLANQVLANSITSSVLRRTRENEFAIPTGLFQTEHQRLMMAPEHITPPNNTNEDRHYLCLTPSEYRDFSECIQAGCYLNREGQWCRLRKAKTKKLKNLRYKINRSPYLMASLIWQAQLRIIEGELSRRRAEPRHAKP